MLPPPPTSTLFPYTTLFRSRVAADDDHPLGGAVAVAHLTVEAGRESADVGLGGLVPDRELERVVGVVGGGRQDRKSTRLNSSHLGISYAVFCLKKKKINKTT